MYSKQKIKNRNICIFLTMRREIRLEIKISKRESKVRERSSNISWHWTIYSRGDIFSIEPNYMLRRIKLFFLYVYHVNSVSPSTTDPRFIQMRILLTYDCHRSKGRKKYLLSIVRSKTSVCLLINGSFSTLPPPSLFYTWQRSIYPSYRQIFLSTNCYLSAVRNNDRLTGYHDTSDEQAWVLWGGCRADLWSKAARSQNFAIPRFELKIGGGVARRSFETRFRKEDV